MITTDSLPPEYRPFQRLDICSNSVFGGSYVALVAEVPPILIGTGATPLVWLQARSEANPEVFTELVSASVSRHPSIRVTLTENVLAVELGDQPIVVVRQFSFTHAEVERLDLRPIGFHLHGDRDSLIAGSFTLSRSTFRGGLALFTFAPAARQ